MHATLALRLRSQRLSETVRESFLCKIDPDLVDDYVVVDPHASDVLLYLNKAEYLELSKVALSIRRRLTVIIAPGDDWLTAVEAAKAHRDRSSSDSQTGSPSKEGSSKQSGTGGTPGSKVSPPTYWGRLLAFAVPAFGGPRLKKGWSRFFTSTVHSLKIPVKRDPSSTIALTPRSLSFSVLAWSCNLAL